MNLSVKKLLPSSLFLMLVPVMLGANEIAQVVYESPDGSTYVRGGQTLQAEAGDELRSGDRLSTRTATVILSLCDGTLVTIYPSSQLVIEELASGVVRLRLIQGEVLGDNGVGCSMAVDTTVGTANVSEGVFGILLNDSGNQGWTLQVRNLDGTVSFVGDAKLDTSNAVVSLLEPNKSLDIPAGEEFIVRGFYNAETNVFSLAQDGVAMALLGEETSGRLRDTASWMASIVLGQTPPGGPPQGGTDEDEEDEEDRVIIEIPFQDVDTASDKG